MKSVQAGKLRHRIGVLAVTQSVTADGSPAYSTVVADTIWGDWEELSGGESIVADKPTPVTTDVVTIRPYAGLTTKHRLYVGGKTLEILAIVDVEGRGRLKRIDCRSIVS